MGLPESTLTPPMSTDTRTRTTISLDPETLAVFKRMADATNMSVSRCMGDWLTDTADAAQMITVKMEEARKAPQRVLREMRAMVAGLNDSVIEAQGEVRARRVVGRASGTPAGVPVPRPPSSNTGVLVPPEKEIVARALGKMVGKKS